MAQDLPSWITSHIHAFQFFGGISQILVIDNLKAGVTHPHRYGRISTPPTRICRNHTFFFSLAELNHCIAQKINPDPYRPPLFLGYVGGLSNAGYFFSCRNAEIFFRLYFDYIMLIFFFDLAIWLPGKMIHRSSVS